MQAKKKILYISQHLPWKKSCGSEMRAFFIRQALEAIGNVHMVVAHPERLSECEQKRLEDLPAIHYMNIHRVPSGGIVKKARWVFDPMIPHPHGNGVDLENDLLVRLEAQKYDLVWFNKLRTANSFSTWSWPHSVVDIDDVPSTFEYSIMRSSCNPIQKLFSGVRHISWRRREGLLDRRFSVLAVCSDDDRSYLEKMNMIAPIHVIPNGAELPLRLAPRNPSFPPRIGFVGLLDYFPNREGLNWFLKSCWPLIRRHAPETRLRIAGKGGETIVNGNSGEIDSLGYVHDLEAEIATWSAMIVPIRIGGGTREKIAYGFGLRCPIVSTSLGASGYDIQSGEEILLADAARDFADSCIKIIRHQVDVFDLTEKAHQKFLLNWNWDAISRRVWAAAEDCFRLNHNAFSRACATTSKAAISLYK
jgi:polysaccharide biosynthesis protein PslH